MEGKIALIRNIIQTPSGAVHLVYETFNQVKPFFSYPVSSEFIGISAVSGLSGQLSATSPSNITKKFVLLPCGQSHIAMPLLHISQP